MKGRRRLKPTAPYAHTRTHAHAHTHIPHPSGVDHTALMWHFRGRVAALRSERRALYAHVSRLQHAHLTHASSRALPPHLTHHLHVGRAQADAAGPLQPGGRCSCEDELRAASHASHANQLAEADAAARVARLAALGHAGVEVWTPGKDWEAPPLSPPLTRATSCRCTHVSPSPSQHAHAHVQHTRTCARTHAHTHATPPHLQEGDWWALLHHVVSAAPGGRLSQRMLDRLELLPLSHHHRFPIYEALAGAAQV